LTLNWCADIFPKEDTMKKSLLLLGFALFLSAALPLHAQGGTIVTDGDCTDSPENPTVILAIVGSAGAFLASARSRIKVRRDSSK
jgi:XrtJ-associated TM-motif-TM protein